MTAEATHGIEWLCAELANIIASYQTPHERRVGHGNLRHECSSWRKDGDETTNIAIIYETPGGSTTQLNITHSRRDGTFNYLDRELGDIVVTADGREALEVVHDHVREIPAKRQEQLDKQVDSWMGAGKSKREVFAELNKLLQTEFLGGRVTTNELKASILHAVKVKADSDAVEDQ